MTANTLYLTLLIATLAQSALLIGALLTSKKSNKIADYLLSLIIGLFSYYVLIKILCSTELIREYPHFTQTYRPIPFLIWAAFYFYTKALTNPSFQFQKKDFLHLIPFGIYFLFLLPYFLADNETKMMAISAQTPLHYKIAVIMQTVLLFFYLVLSATVLQNHQRRIKDLFSSIEKVKLTWLKHLLVAFGLIWGAAFIKAFFLAPSIMDFIVPPIVLCVTIYAIGFYALKQPAIFKDISLDTGFFLPLSAENGSEYSSYVAPKKNKTQKYEYSGLTTEELKEYGIKLTEYLKTEKPYSNSELKLQDLADYFGLPSHQVSQIINVQLKRNFYDLINNYRIDEAKRKLIAPDKQHLNILAIAYEVGFNSKSAFNTAFKKYTNMTPSQFKQIQLKS